MAELFVEVGEVSLATRMPTRAGSHLGKIRPTLVEMGEVGGGGPWRLMMADLKEDSLGPRTGYTWCFRWQGDVLEPGCFFHQA